MCRQKRLGALFDGVWDSGIRRQDPVNFEPRVEQVPSGDQAGEDTVLCRRVRALDLQVRLGSVSACLALTSESCILPLRNRYFASQDKVKSVIGLLRALRAFYREYGSATKAVVALCGRRNSH